MLRNSVPSQITTNSLTETLRWSTFLGLTSDTGPNGDVASMQYRVDGRPWTSTSVYGAVTTYSDNDTVLPATVTATTNGHYAKTTKDGLGRTVFGETGAGSTVISTVDTVYAPCGCNPENGTVSYTYDTQNRLVTKTDAKGQVLSYSYDSTTVCCT